MTFHTNHLVSQRFVGCAIGPFTCIKPEYKDDHGLLAHEKCHVEQKDEFPAEVENGQQHVTVKVSV